MAINKINVLGTIYDIGGGSGGLTGYSTSSHGNGKFMCGLKDDGTYTETFSSSDKYVAVIIANTYMNSGGVQTYNNLILGNPNGVIYQSTIRPCYFVIPTGNDWSITLKTSGGGAGA